MPQWVEGRVVELQQWTDRLYSLRMHAEIDPFRAGQFTRLALDVDGERVARPYSFVNGPDNPLLEFYFITVPGGPLTERLVRLQPDDPLEISKKAAGFFVLDEVPAADDLWMLSTGTAIGPFLSILETAQVQQHYQRVVLVHAVRTAAELTYTDAINRQLAMRGEFLQYVPFVSREAVSDAINARVPAAIEDGSLETRTGMRLDPAASQVMICGNPAMVKDTQAILEARGFRKHRRREPGQVTTEQYWKL